MSEIAFITAAKHQRGLMETQLRLARQHTEAARVREDSFAHARRQDQLINQRIKRSEQQLRERYGDITLQAQAKRTIAELEQAKSTISGDIKFRQNRNAISDELFAVRFEREISEDRLLRNLELSWAKASELNTLKQRAQDIRRAIIKWEARITERRNTEYQTDIQAQANLQLAIRRIDAIYGGNLQPQSPRPGKILNIQA